MTAQNGGSGHKRIYLNEKESEALICIFDNLLADHGMTVPDVSTLEGAARILIKHRGYAIIRGKQVSDPVLVYAIPVLKDVTRGNMS